MVLAEMRSNWWKIAGSWRKDKVRAQISQGLREYKLPAQNLHDLSKNDELLLQN